MIPAERAHLHVAAGSHPGMSGKNNEDRFAVTALRIEGERPLPVVFAVVSDGIGGHRAGEVAAETAVETLSQAISHSDGTQPVETLYTAIQRASQLIYTQSQEDVNKHGMGATVACALVIDNRLFVASVGDSRIYLVRGDTIRQISIDHTWVQEALDAGILTPEQARGHPNAHVIRRYLGSPHPAEPDLRLRLAEGETNEAMTANQGLTLEVCDQVVLCSDGLTDLVGPEEILEVLRENDQAAAIQILTDLANSRGGHDNITIVVLQVPSTVVETSPTLPQVKSRRVPALAFRWTTCLTGLIAMGLLAAVLAFGYLYFNSGQVSPTAVPTTGLQITTAVSTSLPQTVSPAPTGSQTPTPTVWVTLQPTFVTPVQASLTPWPTSTRTP